MTIEFAEKIIEGMVDENGNCGERGMSTKQWNCIERYMDGEQARDCGGWCGDHGHIGFWERDVEGVIGKYIVKAHLYKHFNLQASIKSIHRWIDRLPDFTKSEWQGEPKQRMELELTLINTYWYERESYAGYGYETVNIYTFADESDNCYVWKTTSHLGMWVEKGDGYEDWVFPEAGDKVRMKATVKEHGEYKGNKQTVITRPKVIAIESR